MFNVGDKVYIRAKKLSNGYYQLADYSSCDNMGTGFTDQVPAVIKQEPIVAGRYQIIPDVGVKWDEVGDYNGKWFTDEANLTLISSSAPTTLRSKGITQTIFCRECNEPSQYAEPNCKDGTFACYSCRDTKSWKLKGILNV